MKTNLYRFIIAIFIASWVSLPAAVYAQTQSTGQALLKRFLSDVGAYSANFDQSVYDEGLRLIDEASGTLSIMRPGKFLWDYDPPAEQLIVGDGDKVWIYDIDLEQITVRDQTQALGQTPAILLAGEKAVFNDFSVKDLGAQGEVIWVEVTPKGDEAGFSNFRIGFVEEQLAVLELNDSLGQLTRIRFQNGVENPLMPKSLFDFVPPKGVDVIDES